MSDLFKKLNVLIRASIGDLLSDDPSKPRRAVAPERLGKDIDREIAALRGRVNEALDYEDRLKTRAQSLERETQVLDEQINHAVSSGQDDAARARQEQLARARRGLEMARADLLEHQHVTRELIERVNELESYVAEAKQRQQAQIDASTADTGDSDVRRTPPLSETLRSAREATSAVDPEVPAAPHTANAGNSEADLEQRRQRLSKPSKQEPPAT